MKAPFIFILLSLLVAGCVSKPAAKVKKVTPEALLAVGDCLVLELEPEPNRISHGLPWRRTIDAEGYFTAYVGIKVKIVGMTTTEARDAIASEYVKRNVFRRPPGLVLMRCEDYDREKAEMEQQ